VLDEGHSANFTQNWLPWQHPLRYQKRGPDRSLAPKTLSYGEKIAKIGPRILNDSMPNERISYNFGTLFILYPSLTQKLLNRFSPFLHDLEQLVELLMRASARRYCISFQNTKAKSETVNFDVGKNPPKLIGYHSNVPWTTVKLMSVLQSAYIHLSTLKRR